MRVPHGEAALSPVGAWRQHLSPLSTPHARAQTPPLPTACHNAATTRQPGRHSKFESKTASPQATSSTNSQTPHLQVSAPIISINPYLSTRQEHHQAKEHHIKKVLLKRKAVCRFVPNRGVWRWRGNEEKLSRPEVRYERQTRQ